MKFKWDNRYLHSGVTAFLVIVASVLFYYGIFHMGTLLSGIRTLLTILAPVIYGVVLAYILIPVVNFFENKVIYPLAAKKNIEFKKKGKTVIRWSCAVLTLILFLILIYTLIMMIIPQLIRSIMNIIYSFPYYVRVVEGWIDSVIKKGWNLSPDMLEIMDHYTDQAQEYLTTDILPQMQKMLGDISNGVFGLLTFLKNFVIGAIVSLYVIADKESFVAKSKMITCALLPADWARTVIRIMQETHQTFIGYFSGVILDAAMVGVLCYIGTTLLDIPYAILISVVVGVTNIIPFFGPYIGGIPSALLIILVNPVKGVSFIIFILVLQQIDGNILAPKILGNYTGLSSFMVIVAILLGGGLFGVAGMIAGVPLFAVIHATAWRLIRKVLEKKGMPKDTECYMNTEGEEVWRTVQKEVNSAGEGDKDADRKTGVAARLWIAFKPWLRRFCRKMLEYMRRFMRMIQRYWHKLSESMKKKTDKIS